MDTGLATRALAALNSNNIPQAIDLAHLIAHDLGRCEPHSEPVTEFRVECFQEGLVEVDDGRGDRTPLALRHTEARQLELPEERFAVHPPERLGGDVKKGGETEFRDASRVL